MVRGAQTSRAPIQRLVDQVSAVFVPEVIFVALATFALWYLFGPAPVFTYALIVAATVLVVARLCARGLATALPAVMVATGGGTQHGVLFRNGEATETSRRLDAMAWRAVRGCAARQGAIRTSAVQVQPPERQMRPSRAIL